MKRFDWTIGAGVLIGFTAIALGAWLENLNLIFLWNPTAILIVFGGTLSAILIRRGGNGLFSALKAVWNLRHKDSEADAHKLLLSKLAWLSRSVQKNGVKAYENYADTTKDLLIKQGLMLVAENNTKEQIKQVLIRRLDEENEHGLHDSALLEAAGGFAPTFGVLGAVLGLIGVLRVIDKPDELGTGIATAFVATIYGIGSANLLLFPLAARLRARHELRMKRRDEIAEVILALAEQETSTAIMSRYNLK
ncbi:MAG TPA: MotA/TolQ/ExbB proton channel family protein [Pyrinomonadaceae bacterium]|nr:MotA/TolQ/ExbB proton channel family protein [Pyrinomonadaceae bacterium]